MIYNQQCMQLIGLDLSTIDTIGYQSGITRKKTFIVYYYLRTLNYLRKTCLIFGYQKSYFIELLNEGVDEIYMN